MDKRAGARVWRLLLFAVAAVAGLWLLMSLTYPLGWDQGIFAWSGGVIVHGGTPYKDAWDIKGPLVYYVYALSEAIFGVNLWGIRVIDGVLLIATSLSIGRIAGSLTEPSVARWAGLFYFLWYASNSYWHTAQPDGWAGMVLLVALVPILSSTAKTGLGSTAFVGFCIGVLTLFKPLYAPFLVLPAMHLAMKSSTRRIMHFVTLGLGWVVPIALTAAWFAFKGTLDDLIEVNLRWSSAYFSGTSGDHLRGLVEYVLAGRVTAVALPIMVYGVFALWNRRRGAAIILGSWAVLAFLVVILQNRFFAYHWLPLLPAAVLLVTCGLYDIFARMKVLAVVLCGVILLHCIAPIALEEIRFLSWVTGRIDRAAYYDGYGEPGGDMKAVAWLQEKGSPGSVFQFGWNSGVPWLSGRESVSRFCFSMPLILDVGGGFRVRYRRELMEALHKSPPRYIILGTQAAQILGRSATIKDFPELADFVGQEYHSAAQFGEMLVQERNQ